MLEDLRALLDHVRNPDATKQEYFRAVVTDNCLGKRSHKTRILTFQHLVDLYSLDPATIMFRALVYFWNRDPAGQPLLALLCSYARDPILRSSAAFLLPLEAGVLSRRESLEEFIEKIMPGRFSKATLKSTAQNINSTWTKSGHLIGRALKYRSNACPTPGSASYALFLGYLAGARGQALFETEYARLLDCPASKTIELVEEASRKGWVVFKRIGNIMEALFPNQISSEELEWLREQS